MDRLGKMAEDNGGYLACKKLTWADFYLVGVLYYIKELVEDLIGKHPNLQQLPTNVTTIPQLKKWTEERPENIF